MFSRMLYYSKWSQEARNYEGGTSRRHVTRSEQANHIQRNVARLWLIVSFYGILVIIRTVGKIIPRFEL